MKNVVAVHPHIAGEGVTDGIVAHMSHVQHTGGIRQHFEDVEFLLSGVGCVGCVELGIALPAFEPLGFDALVSVAFVVGTGAGGGGFFLGFVLRHKKIREYG